MSRVEGIQSSKMNIAPASQADQEMLKRMEAIQDAIDPYLEEIGIPATPPEIISHEAAQEVMDTINEIRTEYGQEAITGASMTRRLLYLLNRVAAVVEQHLICQKEITHRDEKKMREETIPELQYWTKGQGFAHALSGFGGPFLLIASGIIGDNSIGRALKEIMPLTRPGGETADKLIESWKMPANQQEKLYNTIRHEREQAIQNFNQLPDKVQQLLTKLIDQLMAMYRATGQRA